MYLEASGGVLAVFGTVVLGRKLYQNLTQRWNVRVECWFCQHKTRVDHTLRNSWVCPSCEQYNGFAEDGSYNTIIPNHYDETLNPTCRRRRKGEWKVNSLCDSCNKKQSQKIKILSSFSPSKEKYFEEEYNNLRDRLEGKYKLCNKCEILVAGVLGKKRNPNLLISQAISKIGSQSQKALTLSLIVSLLLVCSVAINYLVSPEDTDRLVREVFKNYDIPKWREVVNSESILASLVIAGTLIQASCFYLQKNLWCFINWCSWIALVFMAFLPEKNLQYFLYLQIFTGVCSCAMTAWKLLESSKVKTKPLPEKRFPVSTTPPKPMYPQKSPSPIPKAFSAPSSPQTDFGLGRLNLGSRRPEIRSRPPLISPPRLNLSDNFDKLYSRSSSYTSGFASERSPSPSFCEDLEEPNYIVKSPCVPWSRYPDMYNYSPACSPIAYYHFTGEYQRMFMPPSPHSSCHSQCSSSSLNIWNFLYVVPILTLFFSNLALLWALYSQGLVKLPLPA